MQLVRDQRYGTIPAAVLRGRVGHGPTPFRQSVAGRPRLDAKPRAGDPEHFIPSPPELLVGRILDGWSGFTFVRNRAIAADRSWPWGRARESRFISCALVWLEAP